ncbi:ABC transporter C family member 3-like isoform X2 [Amaranthus tricolor]|nr:ABC transporter C family member 3-like isoform X2 [Amaranthus tricolor]XP_057517162.1 ABC transporter C family member 3-like isoform X2 [Amaranthus tricolor]XP_057517163.1 ABC transporter C family member 3-like isoform X2 [Amaranthus tricolor]
MKLQLSQTGSLKIESQDIPNFDEPLLDHSYPSSEASVKQSETVTPYEKAGLLSCLTFSWLSPLFLLGFEKKTLDLDDIPQLGAYNSVFGAFPVFQSKLLKSSSFDDKHSVGASSHRSCRVTQCGLAKACFISAWKEIIWTAVLALIDTLARFVSPYLIDSFVQCLNGREEYKYQGYVLAFIFCAATFLEVFIRRHWVFKMQQVGIRLRAVITVMLYNKTLTLPSYSTSQLEGSQASSASGGELINAVAVDAETIKAFAVYMHDTWLIFVQIVLALLILNKNLGLLATFGAFLVTFSFMLSNSFFIKWQEKFQKKLMESKDNRMKVTMETLKNMRVLKFQGWEMSFLSKILNLRNVELQWLKKYLYSWVLLGFFYGVGPTFVALVTFGSCIYMGSPLELGKILTALATFRVLQEPIFLLPDTISLLIQAKVSFGRIASHLSLDELHDDGLEKLPFCNSYPAVEIVDGNFTWDHISSSAVATLKNINLKISHGMKVGICGTLGSGKSSLLSCILGEMPRISGVVKLCGTKAYVSQSPWIQSGTIKENILFGKGMDSIRYEQVLEACCLKKDLEILSFGDQTVIGERGINLSGGQKQRIQIARALYHDVDIYIFDDPFSAVDAHTGSHLFKEVLLGFLSGKTVIYVTHQVEFVNAADVIVVMNNGEIAQIGKYNDILVPGSAFIQLVGAQNAALCTLDSNKGKPVSDESPQHVEDSYNKSKSFVNGEADNEGVIGLPPAAQLVKEEEREKGSVGFSVYWKYITTAYGGALILLLILANILLQILQIGSTYWLAWAAPSSKNDESVSGSTLMIVYGSLAIGICVCTVIVNMLVLATGYNTATNFFRKMLQSIFHAPMSFFDATPTGRILNRCSTDQSTLETRIAPLLGSLIFATIQLLGIIILMSTVAWEVLVIFIPLIIASIWYQQYYMPLSRELSRLSSICEAPVIQYFSETISGMTTIRSFDHESRFQPTYMKIVDAYSRPEFHNAAAMKWLLLRLDVVSCITFAFLLVLSIHFAEQIDPAIAGLAVTYGLTLNGILSGLIWCLCHCENKMISVERILQYMSIPSEAPLIIQGNRPDNSWPSHGEICFNNLQVRYAPHLPLVLHNITCTFPGGVKNGIVGRTGSGKSTLIQALFRIVEPTAGRILIDGLDISSFGLQDLRSRLSIIPQDPTMFQGTIRSNLDPLEQYTDDQIWDALDKCQLGDQVRKMHKKLDSPVNENGENWSMGQRQLVCLGRVLLKKSKVLVLDEATASVDTATDNLIQQTLKHHFSHCTLIIIAHRITSVLDSDMVLLLSEGRIQEYDSRTRLLQNESSFFSWLVSEYTTRSSSK